MLSRIRRRAEKEQWPALLLGAVWSKRSKTGAISFRRVYDPRVHGDVGFDHVVKDADKKGAGVELVPRTLSTALTMSNKEISRAAVDSGLVNRNRVRRRHVLDNSVDAGGGACGHYGSPPPV
jgi:hypothetical protein